MTAPAAHSAEDLALDACSALRADLAAQPTAPPPPRASPAAGAAPASPPPPVDSPQSWLLLVTSLERAAQLPARRRAAHFRRARAVWDDAAEVLGEPRYADASARLARWRTTDPTLPLVKQLLWAVEQPEAAGYTHLALSGYSALTRLVSADDVRYGYVLAQSARAARTLGDLDSARERYEISERIGVRHRDQWLRVRSALGLGATYQQRGDYPAGGRVFRRILTKGSPDPRFTAAAHHGMVLAAIASEDWDEAFAHGWHLLRAGRRGVVPRADVLLLMAGVCRRVKRYRAALSAAEAALQHGKLPDDSLVARRIMTEVALDTNDRAGGMTHAAALRDALHRAAGTFEQARALHVLGLVEERWGTRRLALAMITRALEIARAHGFHELAYKTDAVRDRMLAPPPPAERGPAQPTVAGPKLEIGDVTLTPKSRRIVRSLQHRDPLSLALAGMR